MAGRKSIIIKMQDRNNELTFKLTEMGALDANRWQMRALACVIGGGTAVQVPDGANLREAAAELMQSDPQVLLNALSNIDSEVAIKLLDEMFFKCVYFVSNGKDIKLDEDIIEGIIQDSTTIFKLRYELIKLHFNFLAQGEQSPTPEQPATEAHVAQVPTTSTIQTSIA